jgi:capsular polysaccharide transport system permease protein
MAPTQAQLDALALAEQDSAAAPQDANLAVHLSNLQLLAGQLPRALATAQRAAALAPDVPRIVRFLSGIEAVAQQPEAAAISAAHAVALAPHDAEARVHLAGVLLTLQRPQAALPHLLAVTSGPAATGGAWRMLSAVMLELGRPDRAIDAIDSAIALSPNDTELRVHRASMLMGRGRLDAALEELDVALQQVPDDARIWRARSGLLDSLGQAARALEDAERAVALRPEDREYRIHLQQLAAQLGAMADGPGPLDPAALDALTASWMQAPRRGQRAVRATMTGADAMRVQARVVFAIMLREMRTRFGRTKLGYVWAIVEPILHLVTLGSVFAWLNHARPPLGNNLYLFYVSGLVPYLMFSHVALQMISALTSSGAIMQLPVVKQTDVIIAKALLTLATEIFVGILVFSGFALMGLQGLPTDLLTCMQAVLVLWLFALGVGIINMVIAEFFHAWETVMGAVVQLMYFASGIYYAPTMMPAWVRDILVWNPMLQGIEWFRSGFYANYSPHWLDKPYLVIVAVSVLLVGIALQRALRERLVVYG